MTLLTKHLHVRPYSDSAKLQTVPGWMAVFTPTRQPRAARRNCLRCEQIRKDASFRLIVTFDGQARRLLTTVDILAFIDSFSDVFRS